MIPLCQVARIYTSLGLSISFIIDLFDSFGEYIREKHYFSVQQVVYYVPAASQFATSAMTPNHNSRLEFKRRDYTNSLYINR
jgi:hypothetical protein